MRDDIVGMLKNAIDHGGNPAKIAQSLINSGYPMKDVKEAYEYVMSSNPDLVQKMQQQAQGQNSPSSVQPLEAQQQPQYQQRPQQPSSSQMPQQQIQQRPQPQAISQAPQNQASQVSRMPSAPVYRPQTQMPQQQLQPLRPSRPLPAQKINPPGKGKIIALSIILLVLIASLVSVIIFKDTILNLLKI